MNRRDATSGAGAGGDDDREYFLGLARGFGAAIIFAIPILLTMEMWWLGFYIDRFRLVLAALLMLPLLIALSHFAGLRAHADWTATILDAFTGYGIGLVAATLVLLLINVVNLEQPPREIVGKIVLLGVAASFGSMLGRTQLGSEAGEREEEEEKESAGWIGEMFFMIAGALYVSLTVASTVEMVLVPYLISPWHALALVVLSVGLMHAFVYSLKFHGTEEVAEGTRWWSLFGRYTLPGYVVATGVAAFLLWTFGRFEGINLYWAVVYSVSLGFPASVGAAAGRLIL